MKVSQEITLPAHFSEAMIQATEAAAQGNPEDQIALGQMYERGDGFPQNFSEAIRWYLKAAVVSAKAKHLVGLMYASGRGVSRDRDTAIRWITEAANSGSTDAQHMLGSMYARGKGVPRDLEKAAEWFLMAAEQGDDSAQLIYGLMLRDGRGVTRDDLAAYVWIRRAMENRPAGQKREIAREALDSVARRLTAEELKQAAERALAYLPATNRSRSVPLTGASPAPGETAHS